VLVVAVYVACGFKIKGFLQALNIIRSFEKKNLMTASIGDIYST